MLQGVAEAMAGPTSGLSGIRPKGAGSGERVPPPGSGSGQGSGFGGSGAVSVDRLKTSTDALGRFEAGSTDHRPGPSLEGSFWGEVLSCPTSSRRAGPSVLHTVLTARLNV